VAAARLRISGQARQRDQHGASSERQPRQPPDGAEATDTRVRIDRFRVLHRSLLVSAALRQIFNIRLPAVGRNET
jgi:hypothetical protein